MRFSLFKGKTVKEKNIFSNRSSHYVKVKKDMHCKNKTLLIKVEIKIKIKIKINPSKYIYKTLSIKVEIKKKNEN